MQQASAAEGGSKADGEAECLRRARAGDARAFEQLYRTHLSRVYGLCMRLADGDSAKAEQYTQDAFVRAWEKLGSFRGESLFSTWMHRLTVNLVLGERRLLKRWVTFEDEFPQEHEHGSADTAGLTVLSQEQASQRMDLERALVKLPKGARTVLMLHDIEGYQHEEIAALTGIAVGTSKAQLHRARRLMRELLA